MRQHTYASLKSRNFSTAEAPAVMKLNFGLPHQTIYKEKVVDQVRAFLKLALRIVHPGAGVTGSRDRKYGTRECTDNSTTAVGL